jgi:arsenate reductase (thioredoxin)
MSSQPKRILFICVENSCRSQIAEAFARMHGGAGIEAFSAGSRPSGKVNAKAIAAMHELGYALEAHASKGLEAIPDMEYDAAVTMGCGDDCPRVRARRRLDWTIADPKDLPMDEFRTIRDEIETKVKELLGDLGSS